jgi:hypothetical protein
MTISGHRFNAVSCLSLFVCCCLASMQVALADLIEDSYHIIKSSDNAAVCATSTPSVVTSSFSKFDCANQCQTQNSQRCDGFNYFEMTLQCQLYYYRPTQYATNLTNCLYFRVRMSRACMHKVFRKQHDLIGFIENLDYNHFLCSL